MKINKNYQNLGENYLFKTIIEKTKSFADKNPDAKIIRLGIGDVTLPLVSIVVNEMQQAALDMGTSAGFKGYGDYAGYGFLRESITKYYETKNVSLDADEIFVSDGVKNDSTNILDIFDRDNVALIPDPVFPVYLDSNIMDGRKVIYARGTEENGFLPMPEQGMEADLIYMCSPNNPTGAVYNAEQLKVWVDYALEREAVILYDGAYESFVQDGSPTSIYQIEGAENCAIEFMSFSKMAGFTGVRCSFTVIPKKLKRDGAFLGTMWLRRQSTKYNGVSYIVQRGANAALSREGLAQLKTSLDYYMSNTKTIASALDKLNIWYTGGKNSPYIWLKCPNNMSSWEFFDYLLEKAHLVGTPGEGFGNEGKGFFRLTAFGSKESTALAMERFAKAVNEL